MVNSNRFSGKVVIVTGGGSGIGEASGMRFAREGAKVVIADISLENAERVAADIGSAALAVAMDAGDPDSIEAMVAKTIDYFGRIDVLHNNAAITSPEILSRDRTATQTDIDVWDRTFAVNVRGYLLGCKFAVPHIIKSGGGAVINTSSNAALHGDLDRIAYGSSKGAINSMTLYIATQFGRQGVRCNAICPGPIVTPAVEKAMPEAMDVLARHVVAPRLGRPDDVAALACFLASDEAEFITGQVISVDGGFRAKTSRFSDLLSQQST